MSTRDTAAEPFLGSQPRYMRPDLASRTLAPGRQLREPLDGRRLSRPLQFNVTAGPVHARDARNRGGHHRPPPPPGPVFARVFKGRWHYLEHDWVAEEGGYVLEPPGETHMLVVPEGCAEMATLFQVNGSADVCGPARRLVDGLRRCLHAARGARARHYESVGVDAGYLDTLYPVIVVSCSRPCL